MFGLDSELSIILENISVAGLSFILALYFLIKDKQLLMLTAVCLGFALLVLTLKPLIYDAPLAEFIWCPARMVLALMQAYIVFKLMSMYRRLSKTGRTIIVVLTIDILLNLIRFVESNYLESDSTAQIYAFGLPAVAFVILLALLAPLVTALAQWIYLKYQIK